MAKQRTLSFKQVSTLFSKNTCKTGEDFLLAFTQLLQGNNKNDIPFTLNEVIKQPLLQDFTFKGKNNYQFICQLEARSIALDVSTQTWKNEKILAKNFVSAEAEIIFNKAQGISYLLTCPVDNKEYIIKIGASRKTFKERLGSYNCGVVNNLRTASTTNIKILQSFVACGVPFNLYIYNCDEVVNFTLWDVRSVDFASSKYLAAEDIMVKQFLKEFGHLPLSNVQSDASH